MTEQQLVEAGAAKASEYARAILADRRITFAEYEGAVLQMVQCAAAGGAYPPPGQPRLDATGSYRLNFTWKPEDAARAATAVADCGRQYLDPVQALWTAARSATLPQSAIERARTAFWSCIAGAGVDIGGRPRDSSSLEFVLNAAGGPGAVQACQERIFSEFGLENFGG